MLRAVLCSMAALAFLAAGLLAANEQKADDKGTKATVVKHDAEKKTLTVRYKDKDGKDTEKTIELKEEMKLLNEEGKDVKIPDFLKSLAKNEAITIMMDKDGKVTEIRDIKDKP